MFLSSRFAELKVDLIAEGPVVLAELNVPFVQKLFEVDRVSLQFITLSFAIYIYFFIFDSLRHLHKSFIAM